MTYFQSLLNLEMEIDYFRVMSRGFTFDQWFFNIIRLVIVQHIEDNIDRYKDCVIIDAADSLTKMWRNGVWDGNWEIQVFTEVYNANFNIHELESTSEPSYKFVDPGASTIRNL